MHKNRQHYQLKLLVKDLYLPLSSLSRGRLQLYNDNVI
jgi:hypothetical protein